MSHVSVEGIVRIETVKLPNFYDARPWSEIVLGRHYSGGIFTVYLYGMTPRQERFVEQYLIDRNGAAAAVRAGYSPHTARQIAYELLTRPDVAEAVRQGEAELAAKAQLAREEVLRGLLAAIDMARSQGDPAAMIAGWREIAKMCGYYAPERKQIRLSGESRKLRTQLETMNDADLLQIAEHE